MMLIAHDFTMLRRCVCGFMAYICVRFQMQIDFNQTVQATFGRCLFVAVVATDEILVCIFTKLAIR